MAEHNFKVVAVLRDDLTPAQRLTAERQLCTLQRKFQIEKIDDETYCKGGPVTDNDDFGPVTFFYCKLKRIKEYFCKLEYYDLWEGEKSVAV